MTMEFPELGIQYTQNEDVEANLEQRNRIKVDPFRQPGRLNVIDLSAIKLCFQVNI